MKKKLMMVAVLLGALFLGACVDDNESQSVTDVRKAKAKQLTALASMYDAEAQAKLIAANADAALKTAQAEAEKAAAAKANAEAEILKKQAELLELQKAGTTIENQKKQAELEGQLAQLEVTKKQAEADLARIANEMETQQKNAQLALLQLELQLKQAQQNLVDYDQLIADAATQAEKAKLEAERERLQTLAQNYSNAVGTLISAQTQLSSMKSWLVRLESGLTDAKAIKEQAIADNNNQIALYQMQIAKYKEYTNYTADITTLKNKRKELQTEANLLSDKYHAAYEAYLNITVDQSAVNTAYDAVTEDDFYRFIVLQRIKGELYWYRFGFIYNNIVFNFHSSPNSVEIDGQTYFDDFGTNFYFDYSFTGDVRQVEVEKNSLLESYNSNKEYYETRLAAVQKQYNGDGPVLDANGNSLPDIEGNATTKNAVDYTVYLKSAYDTETDATKKARYYDLYQVALNRELALKDDVASLTLSVSYYGDWVGSLKKAWAMYQAPDSYNEALQAKIKTYNDANVSAYENKVSAFKAQREARNAYYAVSVELQAVNDLIEGNNGVSGADYITSRIKDLEAEIADLQEDNADVSSITSTEEAITYQKARITAQEAVVKVKQVAVTNAKSDLDAAMPKSE